MPIYFTGVSHSCEGLAFKKGVTRLGFILVKEHWVWNGSTYRAKQW